MGDWMKYKKCRKAAVLLLGGILLTGAASHAAGVRVNAAPLTKRLFMESAAG